MMEYQARIAQGDYPAVINMLGVEISGRSEHIPAKDVNLPSLELTQETCQRFEMSSELNLGIEMSQAAAINWKGGSSSAQEAEKENRGSRVGIIEQNLEG